MKPRSTRTAILVEGVVTVAVLVAVAFVFFTHNGFISGSGIQPYPY